MLKCQTWKKCFQEYHESEVKETMKKLEDAGYSLHPKKFEFFQKKLNGRDTKVTKKESDLYKENWKQSQK